RRVDRLERHTQVTVDQELVAAGLRGVEVERVLAGGDLLAADEDVALRAEGGRLVDAGAPHAVGGELREQVLDRAAAQGRTSVFDRDLLSVQLRRHGLARRPVRLGVGGRGHGEDGNGNETSYAHAHSSLVLSPPA